ncbi:sugar kinase [Lentibacillus sp. L22]|uniref:sugar kinase n=1 Tax=Lentibacillus sp. L22 TaxID=3163028 RepID=UPI0034662401
MGKKIAAFGEVVMRLEAPGHDRLTQTNTLTYSFSGTGVNVTSALTRFGHEGYLVSTVPANPLGDAAVAHLQRLGISMPFVQRTGDYIRMYFLENGYGSRPSRVTNSSRQDSSFNIAAKGTYDFERVAKEVDMVHFCGINLATNDRVRNHMKNFAKTVHQNGGTVIFDCNYRPGLWGDQGYEKAKPHYEEMLSLADIVMMNEKDAIYILGMETNEVDRQAQLQDLLPTVAEKYQIRIIAGTHRTINDDHTHTLRGFMYKNQQLVFADPLTFSVLDRVGAGDAYTSGVVHGELEGYSPEETVNFATAAGMLAHTITGDTPMSTEEEIRSAMEVSAGDIKR